MEAVWSEVLEYSAARQFRSEWVDLAHRSIEPNMFMDSDFVAAYFDNMNQKKSAKFVFVWKKTTDWDSQKLLGVYCFKLKFDFFYGYCIKTWSVGPLSIPLLDNREAEQSFRKILECLQSKYWYVNFLHMSFVRKDGPAYMTMMKVLSDTGCRASILSSQKRPILSHSAQPEVSAAFDKKSNKKKRLLGRKGIVSVHVASEPDAIEDALENFLHVEGSGWKKIAGTALLSSKSTENWARQLVASFSERGLCKIFELKLSNETVSSLIIFETNGNYIYWKSGYRENYSNYSVGYMMDIELSIFLKKIHDDKYTDSIMDPNNDILQKLWQEKIEIAELFFSLNRKKEVFFDIALFNIKVKKSLKKFVDNYRIWKKSTIKKISKSRVAN